jgi:hypothetical protein
MAFKKKFPLRSEKVNEKITETFSNFKYMGRKISVLIALQDINNKFQSSRIYLWKNKKDFETQNKESYADKNVQTLNTAMSDVCR